MRSRRLHGSGLWQQATLAAALVLVSGTFGACSKVPDPGPALENASQLIAQAEQNGAVEVAASDLAEARELLQNARAAEGLGRHSSAARLAHEASVEARLAIARTAAAHANDAFQDAPQE